MGKPAENDPIDMLEVRLVASQMYPFKIHLSGRGVLEVVNEILRRRAEIDRLRREAA